MSDAKTLIRDDGLIADSWIELDDEAAIPAGAQRLIVTLARLRAERDTLLAAAAQIGVRLANTEDVDDIFAEIADRACCVLPIECRSEEHTSELQSLMRRSYAVFCLKTKKEKRNSQQLLTNHVHAHQK